LSTRTPYHEFSKFWFVKSIPFPHPRHNTEEATQNIRDTQGNTVREIVEKSEEIVEDWRTKKAKKSMEQENLKKSSEREKDRRHTRRMNCEWEWIGRNAVANKC
jgi:hypothetical protein